MEEIVYGLLIGTVLIIMLGTFSSRLGKMEKTLNEIKKRLDDSHKVAETAVSEEIQKRELPKKEVRKAERLKEERLNEEWPQVRKEAAVEEAVKELPVEEYQPVMKVAESAEVVVEVTKDKEQIPQAESVQQAVHAVQDPVVQVKPVVQAEKAAQVKPVVQIKTPKKTKEMNYEKFIGENLFGKIGILVFVIGVGLFVKYAIDKDWINETMRTVLGFLAGSALLAIAERLQKKYRTFSSLLAGGAFAVFYLTVAIAFHYYHLFSQTVAFVILVGLTVFMSILSVLYDRRELAITALVGGFLAPFIISTGEGNYMVLFTYLTILNLGMFGLANYKKWGELPVISFAFTYVVMGVYLSTKLNFYYEQGKELLYTHLFIFATLFYFIFLLPIMSILRVEGRKISRILLSVIIVNNFFYLGLGSLFLGNMALPFKAEGLLSLFIAIVNLGLVIWLRKSKQDYKFLIYSMLGLVLTFVSITVPIQLDGTYITLFWASEMVLLLWLYVKSKIRVYEYASFILVCLTFISFIMDITDWVFDGYSSQTIFLNSAFATSLFMGLATGAFGLLIGHYRTFFSTARILKYNPWNAFMLIASAAMIYCTFIFEFDAHLNETMASGMKLLFNSVAILILCFIFRKRFPIERYALVYQIAMGISVFVYLISVWVAFEVGMGMCPVLPQWLAAGFVIATLAYVSRMYFAFAGLQSGFVVYLNVLAAIIWLTMVRYFCWQIGIIDFSAGFSLALGFAGVVQMGLGMRLHQKVMRIISLVTFGIVLAKLALIDLWAMPTVGKIVVFILLGATLLVLSFLYQKLKDVLFKNDDNEVD